MALDFTCPQCSGSGKVGDFNCTGCNGTGLVTPDHSKIMLYLEDFEKKLKSIKSTVNDIWDKVK